MSQKKLFTKDDAEKLLTSKIGFVRFVRSLILALKGGHLTIPDGYTHIDKEAFKFQYDLVSITLPESIIEIGSRAFANCPDLMTVNLNAGLKRIESGAFAGCDALTALHLPKSLEHIGSFAFDRCNNALNITLDEENTAYSVKDGFLLDKDGSKLIYCPVSISAESFIIPDYITSIGEAAFYSRKDISEFVFPEGLTHIDSHALACCNSITRLVLPKSIVSIDIGAFYSCASLKEVEIPNGLTTLDIAAFEGCIRLRRIELPDSLKSLGDRLFEHCKALESVRLPDGIEEIPYEAFKGCYKLKTLTIPHGVQDIGYQSFMDCISLREITIPDSVSKIDPTAFICCPWLTVYCADGSYAADYCRRNQIPIGNQLSENAATCEEWLEQVKSEFISEEFWERNTLSLGHYKYTDKDDFATLLTRMEAQEKGKPLADGLTREEALSFAEEYKRKFALDLPVDYLLFLCIVNGFSYEDLVIGGTDWILECGDRYRYGIRDAVILGVIEREYSSSENRDNYYLYCYSPADASYCWRPVQDFGRWHGYFEDLSAMINTMLDAGRVYDYD